MHYLTWDTGIVAVFAILLAYTILVRKHKSLATLVSVYIGYLMGSVWGLQVAQLFHGDRLLFGQIWIKAGTSPYIIQTAVMVAVAFLVSSTIKLGGKRSRYGLPEVTAYAVGTMALGVSFMLSFMPADTREAALRASQLMPYAYAWREWILVLPVVAIVFFGLYGNEES